MSTASADRLRTRAAAVAAAVAAVHSLVVLIGWSASRSLFVQPSPDFKPMSPSTALAALVLSLALIVFTTSRNMTWRTTTRMVCWMVAAGAILNLLLLLAATALERYGYKILAASDGDAAMALAAEHQGPIHLLLSDGVLSGVRVPELLRRFVGQRPETKILLMSGYSQELLGCRCVALRRDRQR